MMWAVLFGLGLGYVAFLLLFVRHYWRLFRKLDPNRKVQYRITDIWAGTVGFMPTIALTAFTIKQFEDRGFFLAMALVTLVLGLGQLAGLFVGVLGTLRPPDERESMTRSASEIMLFAVVGALLPLCYLAGLGAAMTLLVCIVAVVSLAFMDPAAGFALTCGLLVVVALIAHERRKRGKVKP